MRRKKYIGEPSGPVPPEVIKDAVDRNFFTGKYPLRRLGHGPRQAEEVPVDPDALEEGAVAKKWIKNFGAAIVAAYKEVQSPKVSSADDAKNPDDPSAIVRGSD